MYDANDFVNMTSYEAMAREDAALLVRFELMDIEDAEETKKNGYPCFKQREMCRIRIPGSKEERFARSTPQLQRRFPRAYMAFKAGQSESIQGTPLKECPVLNKSEVSMLNHHGVVSVEQAAALSDENLSGMGHGVRPIRDRVRSWYESRRNQAPVAALQAQLNEKDALLQQMAQRLAALEARGDAPDAAPKPKRNRKPKTQTQATE